MPSAFATSLATVAGPAVGTRYFAYSDEISSDKAYSVAPAASTLYEFRPHRNEEFIQQSAFHALSIWDTLSARIVSGPGAVGRRILIRGAWITEKLGTVRNLAQLSSRRGYFSHTFGGTADPAPLEFTSSCPFSDAMTDVADWHLQPATRPYLAIFIEEIAIPGATASAGAWVEVHYEGTFQCFGNL